MEEDETPKSANQRQVGGDHYNASVQHWDLIERGGMGYLEGCATKYVTRARKKNGLQDVRKAQHYVQKLLELHLEGVRLPRGYVHHTLLADFLNANNLSVLEASIITILCRWSCREHLDDALRSLKDLEGFTASQTPEA